MYDQKLAEVRVLADKINSGLSKLFDAKQDVKTMQVELTAKNLELAEAQKVSGRTAEGNLCKHRGGGEGEG